jgi:hypothetical protein
MMSLKQPLDSDSNVLPQNGRALVTYNLQLHFSFLHAHGHIGEVEGNLSAELIGEDKGSLYCTYFGTVTNLYRGRSKVVGRNQQE